MQALTNGKKIDIELKELSGSGEIFLPQSNRDVRVLDRLSPDAYKVLMDDRIYTVFVSRKGSAYEVQIGQDHYSVEVRDEKALLLESLGVKRSHKEIDGFIKAPIPGLLMKMLVSAGEEVHQGQAVAILEAMKMENEIHAPHGGTVSEIFVEEGQQVDKDQPILKIKD